MNALKIALASDEELLKWDEESPEPELTYDQWEARRIEKREAALRQLALPLPLA